MYGTFTSTQHVEILFGGNGYEPAFEITLVCTARGTPGQFSGPPENCYPSEFPEFGIESITVGGTKISEEAFVYILGVPISKGLILLVELEAEESGEF